MENKFIYVISDSYRHAAVPHTDPFAFSSSHSQAELKMKIPAVQWLPSAAFPARRRKYAHALFLWRPSAAPFMHQIVSAFGASFATPTELPNGGEEKEWLWCFHFLTSLRRCAPATDISHNTATNVGQLKRRPKKRAVNRSYTQR